MSYKVPDVYADGFKLFKNLLSLEWVLLWKGMQVRGPKNIFLPEQAKHLLFFFTHFLPLSRYANPFCPFTFLFPLLLSFPFLPSFLFFLFPFRFFFLFLFFLPGKFEHFSYLPSSTATTLLRFFEPYAGKILVTMKSPPPSLFFSVACY